MPTSLMQEVGTGQPQSRRRFLTNATLWAGAAAGVLVVFPVVAYLLEPIISSPPEIWEDVGRAEEYAVGDTRLVSFVDVGSVPWSGGTQITGVYVRQQSLGQFSAWAENCTHLGCPLNWIPSARIFECPCHGGVFYADGTVAAGPPPRSMFQLPVRLQDGRVQVRFTPLPVA